MSPIHATAFIHPNAEVEDDVVIGPGTKVWSRAHVRKGARLGADCIVGEAALVDLDVALGDRCKVQAHALIYRGSSLDSDVFVGPAACLTNDRFPRASTAKGALKSTDDWEVSGVLIRQGASIGAQAVVVGGTSIGAWAMAGAGSVVTHDIESHSLVVGNPARPIGWVCICGGRLSDKYQCAICARRYSLQGQSLLPEPNNSV